MLAGRSMQLQVNRQDGIVWVGDGEQSVEITRARLGAAMSDARCRAMPRRCSSSGSARHGSAEFGSARKEWFAKDEAFDRGRSARASAR